MHVSKQAVNRIKEQNDLTSISDLSHAGAFVPRHEFGVKLHEVARLARGHHQMAGLRFHNLVVRGSNLRHQSE